MVVTDDQTAWRRIYALLNSERETNWGMPDEFAHEFAYELSALAPLEALQRIEESIKKVREHNDKEAAKLEKAKAVVDELKQKPITNAGPRGVWGYFQRQLLALLNGTANSLARIEVTEKGMFVYQPFATVSQRTLKHKDLADKKFVLGVNPPDYLDGPLGFLQQFRKDIPVPWGEIILNEPGSGKDVASAISFRPDKRVKEIKEALEAIHRVAKPYEKYKRLPRMVDLLIYCDIEGWRQKYGQP